jgi:hypothetical protein
MKVIVPIEVNELTLTTTNAADPFSAAAWSSGTTYGFNALASENGLVYQSLVASGNLNKDPSNSPLYWELIGINEAAWASGTTYAANAYSTYKHRVYLSLSAGNVGNNPYTDATHWEDVGPTNQYAMFDVDRNTPTVSGSPLTVTITPGQRVNSVAILNAVADSVELSMTVAGTTVYDKTTNLITRDNIIDSYSYCFNQFVIKNNLTFFDLPPQTAGVITVTYLRASGNVEAGALVLGNYIDIGGVQYGGSDGMLNFSTISNDTFGDNVLIRRKSVPQPQLTLWAPMASVDAIITLRDQLNAVPAVWVGIEDVDNDLYNSLCVLGVYTQFDIGLTYTDTAVLTLVIKGI